MNPTPQISPVIDPDARTRGNAGESTAVEVLDPCPAEDTPPAAGESKVAEALDPQPQNGEGDLPKERPPEPAQPSPPSTPAPSGDPVEEAPPPQPSPRGVQFLDLAKLEREGVPPVDWLAKPYLVRGEIHVLVGDGYVGKSVLAIDTALGLAAGQPVFLDCEVARPQRVLYVDEDGSVGQISRRLAAFARGHGIKLSEVADRLAVCSNQGMRLDDGSLPRALDEVIEALRPDVVFLDALRGFHSLNENSSQDMALIFRHTLRPMIHKYGFTVVILHHTNKEHPEAAAHRKTRRNASQASRGNTEIRNAADILLYMESVRGHPGVTALTIDKHRSLSQADRPDPLAFETQDGKDGSMAIVRSDASVASGAPKLALAIAELEAALPPDSTEEVTFGELMGRLPGLKCRLYSERVARDALKCLVPSVFSRQEEGKNTYYCRADT